MADLFCFPHLECALEGRAFGKRRCQRPTVLGCLHAHAQIGAIRVGLARSLPGVVGVFTGNNLAWERVVEAGDVEVAFAREDVVTVERRFRFNRHTGVTPEPRSSLVDFDPAERALTYWYSGQAPHMMQAILAKHLGLLEENVRLIAEDVGGSFGIKIHTYGDDIATAAAAMILERPVKFVADRFESFVSDIHARDHRVDGKMAVAKDGAIVALEIDDLTGIGPFSVYPRTSAIECNQTLNLTGASCFRTRM